ncbi:hypothetical protein Xen7305DRAFT_00023960 [Xenococcus sp. PCC 7305]|uniref:hypothetical protein n=1 Tax=Xenococcus sp. PCC 7305 TaxID=102125 RepID=UPI0002AC7C0B|nr:hypothetical protein [Xenococcus sp. PCC 7305]ELS02678.1 hypothetical protein Xen7305DRAFT_00023960 [Xenococcus sp. PCC 7305]
MSTLEMAIQKIRQLTPEQRNKVIKFIEVIELQSNYQQKNTNSEINTHQDQDFFSLAGIWENKNITIESLREEAWNREK